MRAVRHTGRSAADLHWLGYLLTGQRDLSIEMAAEIVSDAGNPYFTTWMTAWSRRIVISKALAAFHDEIAASALRLKTRRISTPSLPAPGWALDGSATKAELERALLAIDIFPRAALVLSIFEKVPVPDVAVLLDAEPDLVREAQAAGLQELAANLAKIHGWSAAPSKLSILDRTQFT